MLSGVKVLDRGEAERRHKEERRREKKERKKHKKEKRSKHKRRDDSSDGGGGGGSSSDGGGAIGRRGRRREQWEDPSDSGSDSEGGGSPSGAGGGGASGGSGLQRDDWMTKPMVRQKTDEQLAAEEEERAAKEAEAQRRDPDKQFVSKRELNPYLRDGGSGVPPEAEGGAAPGAAQRATGVGDGGASWRLKALKRAQQQAEAEGKKVNEIVSERWGSLADLTAGLTERRAAHGMAHMHSARDRRRADPEFDQRQAERRRMREGAADQGEEGEGGDKAAYLSEMKSGRSQMRRPQEGGSLSWRRPDSRGGSGRDSRGEERRRDDRGRDDDRRREERSRGDERRRDERGRDGDRRGDERRRDERPPRPRHDPLGRGQDAAALRAAASELNQFKGDGSFLEQFERRRQEEAQEAEERRQWEASQAARGADGDHPAGGMEVQPSASEDSSDEASEAARERERREMLGQQSGGRPGMAAAMAAERSSLAARAAAPAAAAAEGGGGGAADEAGPAAPQPGSAAERRPGSAGGANLSAAALLRARLTGKAPPPAAPAAEDQQQQQPQQQQQQQEPEEGKPKQETVVLPQVDARGRAVPGAFGREEAGAGLPGLGDRKQKRTQRYEDGERSRYFADDHDTDLQTLIKRTKHGDEGDVDRRLAAGIMRSQRYKQADFDADAEYDHDAGLEHLERRGVVGRKGGREKEAAREKQRQIREYQKHTSALEACRLCFASASRPRQLTLAIGQSTYLALPARGRLVPGHCVIVPADHVASTRQVDEQVWTELRNFKKCLIQMFMKQGQEVIFFETAMQLGSVRSHAVVECVPVPPKAAAKAPMFFKKAIDDATSEWAQHHAKRYIDTKAKGLRGSIPPNFPYLNVEFGIADGFVHVIDDEANFDRSLARSVVIGLLGLPQEDMHRRARQESPAIQQQWADEFRKQFEPYDWTRQLG